MSLYFFPFTLLLANIFQISRKILLNLLSLNDFTGVLTASENFFNGVLKAKAVALQGCPLSLVIPFLGFSLSPSLKHVAQGASCSSWSSQGEFTLTTTRKKIKGKKA